MSFFNNIHYKNYKENINICKIIFEKDMKELYECYNIVSNKIGEIDSIGKIILMFNKQMQEYEIVE
jgi:hypothetical protein